MLQVAIRGAAWFSVVVWLWVAIEAVLLVRVGPRSDAVVRLVMITGAGFTWLALVLASLAMPLNIIVDNVG